MLKLNEESNWKLNTNTKEVNSYKNLLTLSQWLENHRIKCKSQRS